MPNGRVKWFNNSKGYGFILADVGGEDLFVHYSSIQMDGYRTLKAGEAVSFDTVPADRGFHAVAVQRLEATVAHAVAGGTTDDPSLASATADSSEQAAQQQSKRVETSTQASAD